MNERAKAETRLLAETKELRQRGKELKAVEVGGKRTEDALRESDERYTMITPIQDQTRSYDIAGMNVDVVERKRTDEALQKARDQLQRQLEERTAELAEAKEQLHRETDNRKRTDEVLQRERRTLEHMVRASDHERQQVAYDIHDGLAQYLVAAIMQFDLSHRLRTANPGEAARAYDAAVLMVRQSLAEARRLISDVRPPILDESGIVAAVDYLVYEHRGRMGPKIEFHVKVEFNRLASILENAVYYMVQEGLTNARKHSESEKVRVALLQQGEDLRIEIEDWGVGFELNGAEEGRFGLEGIRQRARLLGGRSVIESTPGKGTRIVVDLPVVLPGETGR